jgi:hypothetical protein
LQNIYALPLHRNDEVVGELVIVHDADYIDAQTALWRETFLRVLILVVLIAFVTLVIVRWSIAGPIARAAQWMKSLRTGRAGGLRANMPDLDLLRPLASSAARSRYALCWGWAREVLGIPTLMGKGFTAVR